MDDKDIKELHKILNKSNPNLNELTSILNDNDSEIRTARRMRDDEQPAQQRQTMELRRLNDPAGDFPFFTKPVLHKPVIYKPSILPIQGSTVLHPPLTMLPAAQQQTTLVMPQPLTLSQDHLKPVYYMQEKPVYIRESQPEPPMMVKEESYYVKDSDYQQLHQVVARDQPVYIQGNKYTYYIICYYLIKFLFRR